MTVFSKWKLYKKCFHLYATKHSLCLQYNLTLWDLRTTKEKMSWLSGEAVTDWQVVGKHVAISETFAPYRWTQT